jgi:hypothetical protein
MSTKLHTIIHTAINHAFAYEEQIELARTELKGKGEADVRLALLPIVASYPKYNVPMVDGKGKAEGKKVLDSTHPKYETAKKAYNRLVADIMGKTAGKGEGLAVPAHIAKLAKALAEACKEYEQARKLASTAVAEAFE